MLGSLKTANQEASITNAVDKTKTLCLFYLQSAKKQLNIWKLIES